MSGTEGPWTLQNINGSRLETTQKVSPGHIVGLHTAVATQPMGVLLTWQNGMIYFGTADG